MSKHQILFLLVMSYFMLFTLSSCTRKQAEEIKPDTTSVPGKPETDVVYAGAIQTLFQSKCAGCHSSGGSGSSAWNFNGYTSVTGNADRIRQAVIVNKTMPLGGSLTAAELKALQDWFSQGMKP